MGSGVRPCRHAAILRRHKARLLSSFLISVAVPAHAADFVFSYAGWTRNTSTLEAKGRYPNSTVMDWAIFVADVDAHDYIHQISVSDGLVMLSFEHRQIAGPHKYPLCSSIMARVRASYGDSSLIQESSEEGVPVQRHVWKRRDERLTIRCFNLKDQWNAERVELHDSTYDGT